MTTLDLLQQLETLGVVLRVESQRLLYKPKDAVSSKLRAAMARHKDNILGWLSSPPEARLQMADLHLRMPRPRGRVSTPRGVGRVVAVLSEFIAVQLDSEPAGVLAPFLPFEISSLEADREA